ncbi:Ig-like domain-containing protein [Brenneria goodwinii]|uniref:Ig-like domain-containing protein n=1 Tax=Brenneria goodwinii TaxID=1109412 RepID=UPI001EFA58C6
MDVTAPEAAISIDTITADNVVNAVESNQNISVTGKVGSDVQAGDTVTVTVGNETYQTTVNTDGTTWSVGVPGNVLAGNSSVNATVTTSDAAGNTTAADASRGYDVDVTAPEAEISIDTITADNVVNAAESGQTISVTGQVGANVQAGDTVTVTVGNETYQTAVNAGGSTWSVGVPGSVLAGNNAVNATVTTADAAGNTTTADASRPYGVDTVAPEAAISIDTITADNVVNAAESGQTIAVTGQVGANVQAGDTVTVTVGNETYQTTVDADGTTWSVNVPGSVLAGNTSVSASVTTADAAGNMTTADASHGYDVDITAPEATISIDTITSDNVINAAEAGQTIAVTGQVGANVQAGDTVTVTVGNETYQTTVNADGSTWSVNVPGYVLAGNSTVNATVTTADAAGNTATAESSRGYTVDTVAPEASITIDPVTADNTINLSESNQPQAITITGRVGNDVQVGDTVTVTVGNETYQTTVNADGTTWSVGVPGGVLAGNSTVNATVTTADAAGNTATANASHGYEVDVTAPEATISIDTITADNVINAAESNQTISITGQVGANVQAGDTVTVTVGNETYQTTVNADGTTWSVGVPGSVLAGNSSVNATVTTSDAAGNTATANTSHGYDVDIAAPEASITIDPVTADNTINLAESNQPQTISGRVGNDVQVGDTVTVTVGDQSYHTTVTAADDGNIWSVSVPGEVLAGNTQIHAEVTTSDSAGNPTTATADHSYAVDTVAPEAEISIDTITADNVINVAESGQTISVTGQVGANVQAGDTVTVTVGGESYQTTVNADGTTWNVNVPGSVLADNSVVNATVTTADAAGNTTTVDANRSYGVDTVAPEAAISIDTITADNVINTDESNQTINITGQVDANVQAGDVVTVTVGGETYQTTVNADGTIWSVGVPGSVLAGNTSVNATVTTADAAGNTTTADASRGYDVDVTAPEASITIDPVTADNVINAAESGQTINVTGQVGANVQAGDVVTVTVGSETYQTTVNTDGKTWSVNVPGSILAGNSAVNATVTTTDAAGNTATANASHGYEVDVTAPEATISIDTITADNVINAAESNQTINVTGKVSADVQAGDTVIVTVGNETYQTTVNADGSTWSVNVPGNVLAGNSSVNATVTTADAAGNTATANTSHGYDVDVTAPEASITIDSVTSDNTINLAESNQPQTISGRVGNDVQVGDTVTVTVGGQSYQTTVTAADGGNIWSVSVPGEVLAGNTSVNATVTTADAAGNTATANASHGYEVDVTAPEASITIDPVTSDNTINLVESNQPQNITGRVGNDVQAGDTVTVTVGGQSYQTTVTAASDGSNIWSVSVPGEVLAGNTQIHAEVTTSDAAGNPSTAAADHNYAVDTVAPGASITIDPVTSDNTINLAESNQSQTVSGRVGNDVQAGDTVTVTVGSETYQTTVNADGSTWSISVPGSVLAGNTQIHAEVTTSDAAGNSTTAAADHSYAVDTVAPEATITIDTITADNVINAAESNQTISITGQVGANVQAGDTVTVTVGGESYQTTVNADGMTWSVNVPGSVLAGNTSVNATVTTSDTAGNTTTANASHDYGVDVTAPEAAISIDTITADNVVNAVESNQNISVTGKVGSDVQAGDTVTVTVGSETYQTTVNADGTTWSVNVPGSVLAGNSSVNTTVTTADAAGNTTTAEASRPYDVDTVAPEAAISIDTITADNVINAAESQQDVAVTGQVGANVQAGDTVTVTVGGETYHTTVNADGTTWSVNVPGNVLAGNSSVNATVTTADAAGNTATANASHGYDVDVTAPEAAISIDPVTADNVVNAAESGQTINVTGQVGANVQAGDTVTVTVGGETYHTTVNADGTTWSVNVPGIVLAGNSSVNATVTTADAAGNTATAESSRGYTVDTVAPEASITIDPVTADNTINLTESNQPQTISGRVGNDVQVGDTVTVTVGDQSYQTTVTAADGGNIWSVSVPGVVLAGNTQIHAEVTTSDAAGNPTTAAADHSYAVDTVAPEASITIDPVTADNTINLAESNQPQNITGRVGNDVQAGDTVTVTVGSETYQTTVNTDGKTWSVNVPGSILAGNSAVNATVTTTDAAGNTATANASHGYEVDVTAPEATISIDTITADNVINAAESNQTISITGQVGANVQAGDTVTVTVGNETYQTTVNADGTTWSVGVPGSVLAGNSSVNATVTTTDAAGNTATANASHGYDVDIAAPEASITIDPVTADNTINLAESNQPQTISGRVGNDVQVGDTVTVTVGDQSYHTTVTAADDGNIWSVSVPGEVLAGNTQIHAEVTTSDAGGNPTTAAADHSYAVDTVAPEATITIDTITADNVINAAESGQTINVTGQVGANVQAGDTVTVTVGGESYQTTVNADGTTWSVGVPGSVLAGNSTVNAIVTTADAAGNTTTANASHGYEVDITAPEATITIDTITADNVINAAESGQTINVTGQVGANVQAGDTVTVTVGSDTYQTTVNADGRTWSVNVPGSVLAGNTSVNATVTTTDAAGNTATADASHGYEVDVIAPEASITIDPVTSDNTINLVESNQPQTISGRVGNDVQVGDMVTVTVGGQSYQTTVIADADGSTIWSVSVPGEVLAGNTQIHAEVTTSDAAGNPTTAAADHSYAVDTVAPEASITIDPVTSDNTINLAESNQSQTVSGRVGNDVQAGDTVTVTVGSETYQTTVNADGSTWSISVPGEVLAGNTQIHAEVTTSDTAGNPSTAAADHNYAVDTVAPEASITIDSVTADNTINLAESNQPQNITGRVGNDVQAGDTVTVTVGGESYQTTVNADGMTWSVNVPGSVLAGNTSVNATVTTSDTAGNTTTANASHGYEVDVTAPEATITIDTITADNVINAAESNQTISVTGQVGANVQVGDTVTVTVGGQSYQTTVTADADGGNIWSVNVPGEVLAGNTQIHAEVTTSDAAGNPTMATADHSYAVDTVAPEATISIDTITADNVINAAESNQTINVTGQVGANVQAGDTVTVTVGSETYQTTVNADGSTWSVNVPGNVLAGNSSVNATVTTADAAGNTASANTSRGYDVDIAAPEATISIDTITADNVINAAESGQTIAVTGQVGANVQAGDTVTVTVGSETYQTTVNADGSTWSVNVPGNVLAGNSSVNATVTTADAAGNTATANTSHGYDVDVTAPEATITIDPVTADNTINLAESNQPQTITGRVGNDVQVGDTVTVTVGDQSYQTTVTAADGGNIWSVSVPGSVLAGNTQIHAEVTTSDSAGNPTTAAADHSYAVDTVAPEASITIDPVTSDNAINLAESNQPQTLSGRVGNDVQAGDTVTVMVGNETYQTTVNADGSTWSVNVSGSVLAGNSTVNATVTTSDVAGNTATANTSHGYAVDITAPEASITIDPVTADNVINAAESGQTINVTGQVGANVQAGDTVTVTVGNETYQTTVNTDGTTWSVNVPGSVLAGNTSVNATVTTADAAGNTATANTSHGYDVDVIAPEASITIDPVTSDNTINLVESNQPQTISGRVGNDVQVGDMVTVTVGGQSYQTTVTAADGGNIWSVSVPGAVLAGNTQIHAEVTTSDAAGNPTTATADHSYAVDTVAPEAEISIDTITADNVINAAESNQTINVTGQVGANVQAGDTVTVTVGNETYQTTVNTDGTTWSVGVPGSVLAGNSSVNATVTTSDAAGNTATANTSHGYEVDVTAPEAAISIDTITADNVINAAESGQTISVTGQVGANVQAGDTVTLTVGNETYQTTVNTDGSTWSVNVPGSVLAVNTSVSASVTTADEAGNTVTANTSHGYEVDVTAPEASITIDPVTADNTINLAESNQPQAITGRVGSDVQVGDTVTVTVGSQSYQTTVTAADGGNIWSVSVPGEVLAGNTQIHAEVTTSDAAGNPATATTDHSYDVDSVAPEATITIDTITADNVINAAESGQTIAVTGQVGANVQAGDTVTVTVGNETYQTTVNADGSTWSVNVPGNVLAGNSTVNATVTTADAAGNTATANTSHGYDVDVTAPEASITIDPVTSDNTINLVESNQPQTISGRVGNDVQVGDTVMVTVGGQSYQTTVTAADGGSTWSVSVPGEVLAGNTQIHAEVTTSDAAGNPTTATADHSYAVDTEAPEAEISIDTITADNVINAAESGQTINVTGQVGANVQAGDVVTVTVGGESYQTTVNADGTTWSVNVPGNVLAGNSTVNATVTTADAAGNTATANASHGYEVDVSAPEATISIDTITADNVINAAESNQTINVTGQVGANVQAGDTVTVTVGGESYQTTVNADGTTWSVSVPGDVLAGNSSVNAMVTTSDAAGNTTTADANRPYGVDTVAPEATISIDTITADNVINAAESGQTINVTGQVGANVQAGDTVTVTVGNETYQTTVNTDGTTWSVNVPGSVLAGNSSVNATVTTADTAGNTTTANASHGYEVDVTAPEATISIDTITADNVINAAESNQTISVTGQVGANVQVGDTVTVTVGNETYQTTVNADGTTWSVGVPGSVLAGNSTVNATVTTVDAAGNTTTANASHGYEVDITAPEATISIDTITADNVINAAESGQTIAVTGQVGANVQAGDTVTVTVGSETYQTTVNADGSTWSVGVPGSVLAGNTAVNATVTTADAAGNTATANASHGYEVDVTAPEASITIDPVTADNTINLAESNQPQTISGRVGNDVQVGDTVMVTVGDQSYQTTVTAADGGNIWSVSVPGAVLAGNTQIHAEVTTSDAAGNPTTATADHSYAVDTVAPEAEISIDTITADNVINAAESNQTINVTGQVGANVQAGDTVTVTVGNETYQTTVNADGNTWNVNVPGSVLAGNSSVNATVTTSDAAGNSSTADASRPYGVDTLAPDVDITHFAGDDGYISQSELTNTLISGTSSENSVDLVFTDVNGKSVTLNDVPVVDGTWQTQTDLSSLAEGKITVDATATDAAGNQSQDSSNAVMDITPPVTHDDTVTGTEDTPLHIGWSDLGVSADTASIVMSTLPSASEGTLYFNDGGNWKAVTVGQEFTAQNLDLRFEPVGNAAGSPLSEFSYQPVDTAGNTGGNASLNIDITPVADTPNVTLSTTSGETTLIPETIKVNGGSENGGFDVQDGKIVKIGDGVRVWLSEGDPVPEVVGSGTVAYYSQGNTSGSSSYTDVYVVHDGSGYIQDGTLRNLNAVTGNNGSETNTSPDYIFLQDGDSSKYSVSTSTNNNAASNVNTFDGVNVTYGSKQLISSGNQLEGVIYGDGTSVLADSKGTTIEVIPAQSGYQQHTISVSASLTDTDGSETLSGITLSGLPEGTQIVSGDTVLYTVGSDGTYLIPNTNNAQSFTSEISVLVPVSAGKFDVIAQATSTELANHDSSTGYSSDEVEQYGATVGTTGDDTLTGTHSNDLMVGDVSGLQIMEGQNYNIAFLVDSSGSLSTDSINKTVASLTNVFNHLVKSASTDHAGSVNVFLADFDTNVGQSVSVNLSDADALSKLIGVLNSLASGGGTNYEDVFKTAANWFQSETVTHNGGSNLTYFITDGEPTYYQAGETDRVMVGRTSALNIDSFDYQPGHAYYMNISGVNREVISSSGDVYYYSSFGTKYVIGQVHAEGDGTYEISHLAGTGYNSNSATASNSAEGYALLHQVSNVEAIGVGDSLNASSLKNYDSDGVVMDHIDPSQLSEAILGSNQPLDGGNDTLMGGSGDDILFGDAISFDGIDGNGLQALQQYVGNQLHLSADTTASVEQVHNYITEHSAEFDLSSSNGGNDILNGGAGNDILFGQGGNDTLKGGAGNDLLYGGSGDDLLIGGAGNNVLTGGSGADTFKWQAGDVGHDVIKDFNASEGDRIDLSDLVGELEEGTDISHYIRVTENNGSPTIEVSTEGNFTGDKGGTVAVSITLEHYSGALPSLDSLISKPEDTHS